MDRTCNGTNFFLTFQRSDFGQKLFQLENRIRFSHRRSWHDPNCDSCVVENWLLSVESSFKRQIQWEPCLVTHLCLSSSENYLSSGSLSVLPKCRRNENRVRSRLCNKRFCRACQNSLSPILMDPTRITGIEKQLLLGSWSCLWTILVSNHCSVVAARLADAIRSVGSFVWCFLK